MALFAILNEWLAEIVLYTADNGILKAIYSHEIHLQHW
jgi:hypothetical protein